MNRRISCLLVTGLLLSGCFTAPRPPSIPAPEVQDLSVPVRTVCEAKEGIQKEGLKIKAEVKDIAVQTASGKVRAPELPQWNVIDTRTKSIDDSGTRLLEISQKLTQAEGQLSQSRRDVQELQAASEELRFNLAQKQKQVDDLQDELIEQQKSFRSFHSQVWRWVMTLSVLFLIGAVPVFIWVDKSTGAGVAACAAVAYCMGYFMVTFWWVPLVLGGLILLTAVTWLIRQYRNGFEETLKTVEALKPSDWRNNTDLKEAVNHIQSEATQALVRLTKAVKKIG